MRLFLLAGVFVLSCWALEAQSAIRTGPVRAFQTAVGPQSIVRDSGGNLYVIYRDQFNPPQNDIAIGRSTDGGATWNMSWQTGFATLSTNDVGCLSPCIAIDGGNNLHCAWLHQVSTASRPPRTIRYNRYDRTTQTWGTEATVTTAKFELNYPNIAVDSQNYVWFAHGTTSASWKTVIDRSDQPFAANMAFSPVSPAFASVASSQFPELTIDALDRIHLSYYENGSAGGPTIKHQWMDPSATTPAWNFTALGTSNNSGDYYSSMAADLQGNMYIVYGVDHLAGTADPEWFIRKWDGATQTWSSAITVYKTTRAQWQPSTGVNDGRVISAACDETSGEFYFVYRDVDAGELRLARWRDGEVGATTFVTLANTGTLPANSRNYFIYPQIRGSLNPSFNRTSAGLDILYTVGDQNAPTPSYSLIYDPLPVASITSSSAPKVGTTYAMTLSAVKDGGKNYAMASCVSGAAPGVPIDRRFLGLVPDGMFFLTAANLAPTIFQTYAGTLSPSGSGAASIVIPAIPALVGVKVWSAFVTYPGSPSGINAISNSHAFTMTS